MKKKAKSYIKGATTFTLKSLDLAIFYRDGIFRFKMPATAAILDGFIITATCNNGAGPAITADQLGTFDLRINNEAILQNAQTAEFSRYITLPPIPKLNNYKDAYFAIPRPLSGSDLVEFNFKNFGIQILPALVQFYFAMYYQPKQ